MTSQPDHFAVVFETRVQRVTARVSGEIDMDDADDLRKDLTAALTASRRGLDVDLADVTFCDSQGLHLLLDLDRLALQVCKTLVLTALSRPVARLLHITGADRVLTVNDSRVSDVDDFRVKARRYGPTVHLTLAGQLDMNTQAALDEVQDAFDGVDVVACDMQEVTFVDVAGLHALLGLVTLLEARGIAVFAYNWQPRPRQQLLDLADEQARSDTEVRPTRILRRLEDFAAAARTAGSRAVRQEVASQDVHRLG
ncbi:STAS domain-containing protein [Streptomyces sp. NPDC059071]|uniref:STAS domain-containing protein n=1 Tax=unclassified Streptomyces TaxID=2593676 RepID=UPI0036551187